MGLDMSASKASWRFESVSVVNILRQRFRAPYALFLCVVIR